MFSELQNVCCSPTNSIESSGKLTVLFKLLNCLKNERIVIVSSRTRTLDLIQRFCDDFKYVCSRLDGSVLANARQTIVNRFNDGRGGNVFLLSAKAGGVGLNLTGASRLVLFDTDWNPATDIQAMARVWRDGQKWNVFLYRFLTAGL